MGLNFPAPNSTHGSHGQLIESVESAQSADFIFGIWFKRTFSLVEFATN